MNMNEIICKFEQMNNWLKDPQWWAIVVALVLGLIGIFQDWLRKKIWKPDLKIEFRLNPPDSHKTMMRNSNTNKIVYPTYYLRARIENTGNYQLEDVEAMVTEKTKREPNGQFKRDAEFLPLNLIWTVTHEITKSKIQPGLFKFIDFGHVEETRFKNLSTFGLSNNSRVVLELCTETSPNTGSHIIFPGEYRIKIIIAANNLKPITKIYSLVITDNWTDNQSEMFEKNIFVKEEKSMY